MRSRSIFAFALLILLVLTAACSGEPEVAPPSVGLEPNSVPEDSSETTPPEPEPSPTVTKAPNHKIRIDFLTTGDYANLEIYNPENIVSTNLVSVSGNPTNQRVDKAIIALNQPIEFAKEGGEIGLIVDYEIDSAASDLILDFRLQSSPINGSLVRIYLLVGDEYQLVHEEEYKRDLLPAGQKAVDFSFDFNSLAEVSPGVQVTPTPHSASNFILRIELGATADYASFRILQPGYVVAANFVSSSGDPTAANYYYIGMGINQDKNTALAGNEIGLTVDYEIAEAAAQVPLNFELQSGALNTSSVRLSLLVDGQFQQIYNGEYDRRKSPGGKKFKQFSIDLDSMTELVASGENCNLFNGLDLDIYYLDIKPGDTVLTLYAEFPDEVIGLQNGKPTMVYGAQLGDTPGQGCRVFEGDQYFGRLYCFHSINSEDRNAAQPWALYVNGCEEPIHEVPLLSLIVTPLERESADPDKEKSCGPEPSWKYDWDAWFSWCYGCMGWLWTCDMDIGYGCGCFPFPDDTDELLPAVEN